MIDYRTALEKRRDAKGKRMLARVRAAYQAWLDHDCLMTKSWWLARLP